MPWPQPIGEINAVNRQDAVIASRMSCPVIPAASAQRRMLAEGGHQLTRFLRMVERGGGLGPEPRDDRNASEPEHHQ
jgi:hypothetical protein